MKLTEKQKAFCDYYIESLNATESYKKAYNCKKQATAETNSSRLLSNAKVKSYVDERLKEIESKRIAKAEEVLAFLSSSLRGEIDEDVVVVEGCGEGQSIARVVTKQLSAKDRIKAAELLGKRYRLFTDKIEADVNQVVIFEGEEDLED